MIEPRRSQVAGVGHIDEVLPTDMNFRGKSGSKQMSPSRQRAAARTKRLSVNVNPELYDAWDALREDKELSVVRMLELSLIAHLRENGEVFDL